MDLKKLSTACFMVLAASSVNVTALHRSKNYNFNSASDDCNVEKSFTFDTPYAFWFVYKYTIANT